jgi:hypothetical protein
MSEKVTNPPSARVVPSRETPSLGYFYQSYEGKGGSASAKPSSTPERKFTELQNLVVNLG